MCQRNHCLCFLYDAGARWYSCEGNSSAARQKDIMAKTLIIVESPAKTRTIRQFVGKEYEIEASMGHVRDLPKSKLGVDVENQFAPQYVSLRDRAPVLKKLAEAAKKAEQVYLATDPDREGEAIAWHLAQALKLADPKRIEFNEITKPR